MIFACVEPGTTPQIYRLFEFNSPEGEFEAESQIRSGKLDWSKVKFRGEYTGDGYKNVGVVVRCNKSRTRVMFNFKPTLEDYAFASFAIFVGGSIEFLRNKAGNEKSSIARGAMAGAIVGSAMVGLAHFFGPFCGVSSTET